jgi:hypothetical protein
MQGQTKVAKKSNTYYIGEAPTPVLPSVPTQYNNVVQVSRGICIPSLGINATKECAEPGNK